MTSPLATTLALVVIGLFGLLFGVLLALLGILAYSLYKSSADQRQSILLWRQEIGRVVSDTSATTDRLRLDLLAALSKFDADRLYEASQVIQQGAAHLAAQVQTLGKVFYASAAGTAAGIDAMFDPLSPQSGSSGGGGGYPGQFQPQRPLAPGFTMEDEAADDARMLRERNRWSSAGGAYGGTPPPTSLSFAEELTDLGASQAAAPPDPFAGLTQAERQSALDRFWAERRAGLHGGRTAAEVLSQAAAESPAASQPTRLPDLADAEVPDLAHPEPRSGGAKGEMED